MPFEPKYDLFIADRQELADLNKLGCSFNIPGTFVLQTTP